MALCEGNPIIGHIKDKLSVNRANVTKDYKQMDVISALTTAMQIALISIKWSKDAYVLKTHVPYMTNGNYGYVLRVFAKFRERDFYLRHERLSICVST